MDDDYDKLEELQIDSLFWEEESYVHPNEITFCNYINNRDHFKNQREDWGKEENVILFPKDTYEYTMQRITSENTDYLMREDVKTFDNVINFETIRRK